VTDADEPTEATEKPAKKRRSALDAVVDSPTENDQPAPGASTDDFPPEWNDAPPAGP
jgi:hypothetical protein